VFGYLHASPQRQQRLLDVCGDVRQRRDPERAGLCGWSGAAGLSPDLRQQSPELALLVIAFDFTLPMALWMRFRGMAWRPTLEMSGATIGLAY
jgi:hypothetical protein